MFLCSLSTLTVAQENATIEETEEYEDDVETTTEVEATTVDLFDDLQPILKEIQRRVYPIFSELLADPNLSNRCAGSLVSLLRGLQNQKKWAMMSKWKLWILEMFICFVTILFISYLLISDPL